MFIILEANILYWEYDILLQLSFPKLIFNNTKRSPWLLIPMSDQDIQLKIYFNLSRFSKKDVYCSQVHSGDLTF